MRSLARHRLASKDSLQNRQRPCRLMRPSRTSRMSAPMVAVAIAAPRPAPIRTPSLGSSQNPISAPITPTPILPIRPKPQPLTIRPASQPATNPTSRMTSRLSPDIALSVLTNDRMHGAATRRFGPDALVYALTKAHTYAHPNWKLTLNERNATKDSGPRYRSRPG